MAALAEATDANFEQEVLKSDIPVLVDFWAPGCPPCRVLGPRLEKVSAEFAGKVKFLQLDASQQQQTARRYRVQAVPTVYIFKNGEIIDSAVGLQSEDELRRRVTAAAAG